ncbi:hypothetical protein Tco_0258465, partial [Tanacetum coccineum]
GQPEASDTDQSWAGTKYQVDKTQFTRFKVSDPDDNKGKTSSEVDLALKPCYSPLLLTFKPSWKIPKMNSKMLVMMIFLKLENRWMKTFKSLILKKLKHIIPLITPLRNPSPQSISLHH